MSEMLLMIARQKREACSCMPSNLAKQRSLLNSFLACRYTDRMMCFAYERFLPEGMRWRDLFDMVSSIFPR